MATKILHTADWHLGQIFHNNDRQIEHVNFLQWLVLILQKEKVDVLLVSGDVFDSSNPSPEAQQLYYKFLGEAMKANPDLQIIITAGNHDSAKRLEAPKAVLKTFGIHVVGKLKRLDDNQFNFEKVCIPIYNKAKEVEAYCLAIPYLRPSDFVHLPENFKNYSSHVSKFYQDAYQYLKENKDATKGIIAMGHMHTNAADIKDENRSDTRHLVGGSEHISIDAFNDGIAYVALGHIHKAQCLGGKENIRYSGSPLPMSFTEKNYGHEVVLFDLINNKATNINPIQIPVTTACIAIPKKHATIDKVLLELLTLPEVGADDIKEMYPYVCVNILVDGPDPERRLKIEAALENKQVRFVKIDCKDKQANANTENKYIAEVELNQLQPETVFLDMYTKKYQEPLPENLLKLFRSVVQNLDQA
jgi:DNA repair protein SbcD/Mre11